MVGATKSSGNGSWDAYLARFNATGVKQWEKTYGGSGGEWCYGIKRLSDGNYVLVGGSSSDSKGSFDIYLLKVDADGNLLWSRTFGGAYADSGFAVAETRDKGLIVTGYYSRSAGNSRAILLKTDSEGNRAWDVSFGNASANWGKSVIQTSDGGFAIAGWRNTGTLGKVDLFITRTDANGTLLWELDYGGAGDDLGYGIAELPDGGLLASGHTASYGSGKNDIYSVRTDSGGNVVWNRTYGGTGEDYGGAVYVLADGYIFGGASQSFGNYTRILIVRTDLEGRELWNGTYGIEGVNSSGTLAWRGEDGSCLLAGDTNEYASGKDDALVMKLGGNAPAARSGDVAQKTAVVVTAVAVGTGMGFLGLYLGRILDYLAALLAKFWAYICKILPIDTVFDFFYGLAKTYSKSIIFRKLAEIEDDHARPTTAFLAGFSSRELAVITVASVLLGIAYLVSKKMELLSANNLLLYCIMAGLVIILHDLAHRYYAHKYKAVVEYKFWGLGTLIMFATAFIFGIVYAVPARTIINDSKNMSTKEQAIVYLAGPTISAVLAVCFLLMLPAGGFLATVGLLGVSMNLLSAVYSLLPVDPMDGVRVYNWKKNLWALVFVPLLIVYIVAAVFVM